MAKPGKGHSPQRVVTPPKPNPGHVDVGQGKLRGPSVQVGKTGTGHTKLK